MGSHTLEIVILILVVINLALLIVSRR